MPLKAGGRVNAPPFKANNIKIYNRYTVSLLRGASFVKKKLITFILLRT